MKNKVTQPRDDGVMDYGCKINTDNQLHKKEDI